MYNIVKTLISVILGTKRECIYERVNNHYSFVMNKKKQKIALKGCYKFRPSVAISSREKNVTDVRLSTGIGQKKF